MHKLTLLIFLAVGFCAHSLASASLISPYTNQFPDDDSVSEFSPTLSGQWSVVSGRYQNTILADLDSTNNTSSSTRPFPELVGSPYSPKDFTISTVFTITGNVGNFNTLGFSFLSNRATETAAGSSLYVADLLIGGGAIMGQLRFGEIGSAATLPASMVSLGKILKEDTPYFLQLEGKYALNGDLNLNLTLLGDNALPASHNTAIPANNVLQGDIFGFRNRTGSNTSAMTVQFENLTVAAIPEPSSIGFVAASLIGGYALGRYWRRRQAKNNA